MMKTKQNICFWLTLILTFALHVTGCGMASRAEESRETLIDDIRENESADNLGGETTDSRENGNVDSRENATADNAMWGDVDYRDVYRGLLNFYSDFLDGTEELSEEEMNYECRNALFDIKSRYAAEEDAGSKIGYCIKDISGDGVPELLIGLTSEWQPEPFWGGGANILSVYTCVDGAPRFVFGGWSRNHYWLMDDNSFYHCDYNGSYTWYIKYRLAEDGTNLGLVDCWMADSAYTHSEIDDEGKSVDVIDWKICYSNTDRQFTQADLTDMSYDDLMAEVEKMKARVVEPEMTPFAEFVREEGGELIFPWDIAEIKEIW